MFRRKERKSPYLDEFPELYVSVMMYASPTDTVAFVYDEFPPETLVLELVVVTFCGAEGLT